MAIKSAVLDSSAMLAYLLQEPGGTIVKSLLEDVQERVRADGGSGFLPDFVYSIRFQAGDFYADKILFEKNPPNS